MRTALARIKSAIVIGIGTLLSSPSYAMNLTCDEVNEFVYIGNYDCKNLWTGGPISHSYCSAPGPAMLGSNWTTSKLAEESRQYWAEQLNRCGLPVPKKTFDQDASDDPRQKQKPVYCTSDVYAEDDRNKKVAVAYDPPQDIDEDSINDLAKKFDKAVAQRLTDGDENRTETRCQDSSTHHFRGAEWAEAQGYQYYELPIKYKDEAESVAIDRRKAGLRDDDRKGAGYGFCTFQYTSVTDRKSSKAFVSGVFAMNFGTEDSDAAMAWDSYLNANYGMTGFGHCFHNFGTKSRTATIADRDSEQGHLRSIYKNVIATGWLWKGSADGSAASNSGPAKGTSSLSRAKAPVKRSGQRRPASQSRAARR